MRQTDEGRKRIREAKLGDKNPLWKGDQVGYNALHAWIRRRLPKPPACEICNKPTKYLDLANISGKYLRRLDDWEYICRVCHMKKDGRRAQLIKRNREVKDEGNRG
jgi:hypothetical protein